jgi:hypothetical protein
VLAAGLAGAAIIAASYLPLLAHEIGLGFPESRALIEFIRSDVDDDAGPLPVRIAIVWLRVLSWPLAGLATDRPQVAVVAATMVLAALGWRLVAARGSERTAVRWLAATLAWGATSIAIVSSSLARVVPGLPNDHYHAFLDPVVFVIVGLAAGAVWRARRRSVRVARVAVTAAVAGIVALNVAIWPPRVASDGGYPGAERAAAQLLQALGGRPYVLLGEPAIKSTDAYAFPLGRLGRPPDDARSPRDHVVVIACDRLLEAFSGPCGGTAEDRRVASLDGSWSLEARFDASSRTVLSIYAPVAAVAP